MGYACCRLVSSPERVQGGTKYCLPQGDRGPPGESGPAGLSGEGFPGLTVSGPLLCYLCCHSAGPAEVTSLLRTPGTSRADRTTRRTWTGGNWFAWTKGNACIQIEFMTSDTKRSHVFTSASLPESVS